MTTAQALTLAGLTAGSIAASASTARAGEPRPAGEAGALGSTLHVTSPTHHVPLLELFTSEGCSSCPPADARLSRLGTVLAADDGVVPLAFHVTYWDHIGWHDRFGSSGFDVRQKAYASTWSAPSIYTPAFVLDGREVRGQGRLDADVAEARTATPSLVLTLTAAPVDGGKAIAITLEARGAEGRALPDEPLLVRVAVFERGLTTAVKSGENGGRTLAHDFVVRALPDPATWDGNGVGIAKAKVSLPEGWKQSALGVAGFVQGERTRRVYESLAGSLAKP